MLKMFEELKLSYVNENITVLVMEQLYPSFIQSSTDEKQDLEN